MTLQQGDTAYMIALMEAHKTYLNRRSCYCPERPPQPCYDLVVLLLDGEAIDINYNDPVSY